MNKFVPLGSFILGLCLLVGCSKPPTPLPEKSAAEIQKEQDDMHAQMKEEMQKNARNYPGYEQQLQKMQQSDSGK